MVKRPFGQKYTQCPIRTVVAVPVTLPKRYKKYLDLTCNCQTPSV